MSKFAVPYFTNPGAPDRPSFDDVFGIDEFKEGSHGSPELDADAAKLIAMREDPGPTDAEIDRSLARMDHVLGPGWQDEVERVIQEKMMGPDHSKRGIFVYHRCWKCDDDERPCVNGSPRRCDYPRARND